MAVYHTVDLPAPVAEHLLNICRISSDAPLLKEGAEVGADLQIVAVQPARVPT